MEVGYNDEYNDEYNMNITMNITYINEYNMMRDTNVISNMEIFIYTDVRMKE